MCLLTYQNVGLGLCKVIANVQRVEPEVEEVFGKITLSKEEATGAQILRIGGHNEIDILSLYMRKRLDDAIGRHDGDVLEHEGFETVLVEDVRFK